MLCLLNVISLTIFREEENAYLKEMVGKLVSILGYERNNSNTTFMNTGKIVKYKIYFLLTNIIFRTFSLKFHLEDLSKIYFDFCGYCAIVLILFIFVLIYPSIRNLKGCSGKNVNSH